MLNAGDGEGGGRGGRGEGGEASNVYNHRALGGKVFKAYFLTSH